MYLKNKKGQALVEFVIILPIFIFMIFACIDIGKILSMQNHLESRLDDVITDYQKGKNESHIITDLKLDKENISLSVTTEKEYLNFKLEKKMDLITPGLNLILGNPFEIKTNRVIYNE